jgi:hypothetical protein
LLCLLWQHCRGLLLLLLLLLLRLLCQNHLQRMLLLRGLLRLLQQYCAMLLLLLLLLMIRSLPCSNLTQTVPPLIQGAGTVAVAFCFAYYNVDALHCSRVVLRV